jgi:hypothetical protein
MIIHDSFNGGLTTPLKVSTEELKEYTELENEKQSLERQLECCRWKDQTLLQRYNELEARTERVDNGRR